MTDQPQPPRNGEPQPGQPTGGQQPPSWQQPSPEAQQAQGGYPPQGGQYPQQGGNPMQQPGGHYPQQQPPSAYPAQPPGGPGYPQQPPGGYPAQPPAGGAGGYPPQPPSGPGYPQQPPGGAGGKKPGSSKAGWWLIGGGLGLIVIAGGVFLVLWLTGVFGSDETQEQLSGGEAQSLLITEDDLPFAVDESESERLTSSDFDEMNRELDQEEFQDEMDAFYADWEAHSAELRSELDEFGLDYPEACFDALDEYLQDEDVRQVQDSVPEAGAGFAGGNENGEGVLVGILSFDEEINYTDAFGPIQDACGGEEISYMESGIGFTQEMTSIDHQGFAGFRHRTQLDYDLNQLPGGNDWDQWDDFDQDDFSDPYGAPTPEDVLEELERELQASGLDNLALEYYVASLDHGHNSVNVAMIAISGGPPGEELTGSLTEDDFYAVLDAQLDRLDQGLD